MLPWMCAIVIEFKSSNVELTNLVWMEQCFSFDVAIVSIRLKVLIWYIKVAHILISLCYYLCFVVFLQQS